jgi:hypothetical protein
MNPLFDCTAQPIALLLDFIQQHGFSARYVPALDEIEIERWCCGTTDYDAHLVTITCTPTAAAVREALGY